MIMEQLLVILVPLAVFVGFGFAGFKAQRATGWGGFGGLAAIWGGFTLWMILAMNSATGWDALGYVLGLMFLSAPSGAGVGVGALTGWLKQRSDPIEALT